MPLPTHGVFLSSRVYVCPTPEAVQKAAAAAAAGAGVKGHNNKIGKRKGGAIGHGKGTGNGIAPTGETALVLKTKAVLHATLRRTELTCLDWNPHDPTLLLAGTADGKREEGRGGGGAMFRGRRGGGVHFKPPIKYGCYLQPYPHP